MTPRPRITVEVNSIPCPWVHCSQQVALLTHAPASDRLDETVTTVEQHPIAGPNYWYRPWCPASHLIIPLSEKGREVLLEHSERFGRALAQRMLEEERRPKTDLTAENEAIEKARRKGLLGHMDRPPEEYFPPRPSDVEEARADLGMEPLTADMQGITLGGNTTMSDALHDQLVAATHLFKESVANSQESLSVITDAIDQLDAQLKAVDEQLEGATVMAAAAVGSSATAPAAGSEMGVMAGTARTHIENASAALVGVNTAINDAFQAAHHAVEKADEYLQQISR